MDGSGVRLSEYARSANSALTSPDRSTVAVVRREDVELRARTTVRLAARATTRSAFTTDSRFLLLNDEERVLRVFAVAGGRLVREIPKVDFAEWHASGSTLLYRRRGTCEVYEHDLDDGSERLLPARVCERVIGVHARPSSLLAGEPAQAIGHFQAFFRVDPRTDRRTRLVGLDAATRWLFRPVASRALDRLCFLANRATLRCVDAATTRQVELAPLVTGHSQRLDETGRRALFLISDRPGAPEHLFIADATTGESRRLLESNHEWWTFLPGNQRVVGHGGEQGFVVADLVEGWFMELGERGKEYEDVGIVPGDPSRFFIGRERDATRDIYLVELGR